MTGRFERRQIKLRTNRFWKDHWWWALPGVLLACAAGGLVGAVLPIVSLPMWAVLPLMVLSGLIAVRPFVYGTYHLEMGAEAEAWTSRALKKASGPGWHIVDGVSFAYHDVDHVLVGPGGVYAIETKYTDSTIDLTSRRGREIASRWADQAVEGARSLRLLLRDHQVDQVYSGVLVWGTEMTGAPCFHEGVPLLRRRDLDADFMPWRREDAVLAPLQVEAIFDALREYRDSRIQYIRASDRRTRKPRRHHPGDRSRRRARADAPR